MHKINLPLGTRAEFGEGALKKQTVIADLHRCLQARNFMKVDTPLLEYQEVFANFDLKQMRTYQLLDKNNQTVVLRPDLTLPIARLLATTNIKLPEKFYYVGDLFKIAKELSGRNNQMTQAGIELVGYTSIKAELECLLLINRISRKWLDGRVKIEIGHARFADDLLSSLTIDEDLKQQIKQTLFHKKIPEYENLIALFADRPVYPFLQKWPRLFGSIQAVAQMLKGIDLTPSAKRALTKVMTVADLIAKIPGQEVMIDLSAAPPQQYYTGLTFKGFVDDLPDYLFSGGRYDQLLADFQSQAEAAVGMGIDIDLLAERIKLPEKQQRKTYLFFQADQAAQAAKILAEHNDLVLSLEDDWQTAARKAHAIGADLLKINEKGEVEHVFENSFD
ncbi:ATP phosphoribosyltransferase regulatory subunit [Oenococcus kitaharae]|uniref:ATP phosphoribosyltransferase regulatory subunit n=1 Tax=Oenococcus kitaharae DSM 17330 TaxID=1045004 RepID=G9WGE6_9LACO|nr:ATP phosphoribosyltransferase regulatory subunit [Oenococcus kitaharae]EHN59773.1 ATP phosphoribosyltransferase regulatory subunit [Oenococcus kitaharae DSM 17330]OEY83597.1 cytochrome C [Oenococcus kitaharae]OEY85395.1 cytochrome C [Oenococcus kitaharae]OEY86248.1 cytochrome C [Oenococcus kitaharae]